MAGEKTVELEMKYQERYLWEDPLDEEAWFKENRGAVLLAEEIRLYAEKFQLLIPYLFDKGKIKGASYSMTPDPNEAWIFDEKKKKAALTKDEDEKGFYLLVPKNSLVYIRLQQKLRLPFYIIGRHNLTIKYAYQGLLLGTGPQVDPGYEGNLFIPLHNLTYRDVKIYLDKTFVSIDFVRTATLQLGEESPKSRTEFCQKHPEKCCIPQAKLNRNQLEDYLKKKRPTSSLGIFVDAFKEAKEKFDSLLNKIRFDVISVAGLAIAVLAIMTMAYFHLDGKLEAKVKSIRSEAQSLSVNSERLTKLEQTMQGVIDIQQQVRKSHADSDNILTELKMVQGRLRDLGKRIEEMERKANVHQPKAR